MFRARRGDQHRSGQFRLKINDLPELAATWWMRMPYRRIRFGPSKIGCKTCGGTWLTLSSWYFVGTNPAITPAVIFLLRIVAEEAKRSEIGEWGTAVCQSQVSDPWTRREMH
ncbi:PREDICTED: uncharacterized protein LOC106747501 [Dinoponera quadriceps]|uniref:Uncharacterized protein LOC106747501 n=1 Tax=Dinoponera quadriceps TaxID=609295 RepID=A0A6P3XQB1_DINQU|nr:PREDICTED: uncharacterized protein LOC106747501 [Dinoponera quadriceps]